MSEGCSGEFELPSSAKYHVQSLLIGYGLLRSKSQSGAYDVG